MRKFTASILSAIILLSLTIVPLSISLVATPQLLIVEWVADESGRITAYAIPPTDNSATNPHYATLSYKRISTANYYINPSNKYGFSSINVVATITASANAWDAKTSAQVFLYKGTTTRASGKYDGYNVVTFSSYSARAIAVTYIWASGGVIRETDMRLNTHFKWSLSAEAGKMDVQNIATHEFGHWFGLADLYSDGDYWLTMYGYGNYGETYKRSLGLGDINGVKAIFGA